MSLKESNDATLLGRSLQDIQDQMAEIRVELGTILAIFPIVGNIYLWRETSHFANFHSIHWAVD